MKTYFQSLDEIQQFTMELDRHQDTFECKHCLKRGQLVSHGFVYKKGHNGMKQIVGKRIFCSNRNGRCGCGGSFRIYLQETIPTLAYAAPHVFKFLCALLSGCSIRKAYNIATNADSPRNAYRWLHKLHRNLMTYRSFLRVRTETFCSPFKLRTRRLQLLLPTLQGLVLNAGILSCAHYQSRCQQRFI